ncbi:MAG: ComEC/Rec2 family competence protein [Elusimicrobia bacterium]|nr:ComEC/Rec2 family competence protein [Elusimicrobiota bacterium]
MNPVVERGPASTRGEPSGLVLGSGGKGDSPALNPYIHFYMTGPDPRRLILNDLVAGVRFLAWARLAAPTDGRFPGGFSWKEYLADHGASGQLLIDRPEDLKIEAVPSGFEGALGRLRARLAFRLKEAFPDPEVSALLAGLVLGDKRFLDAAIKEDFIAAGVMHLLVVSGLHVALWGAFLLLLLKNWLGLPRQWFLTLALFGTWTFAVFIGITPPVIRAALMFSFILLVPLVKRETAPLSRLFLAALILLAIKPAWLFDPSFLLSFMSTFGILYGWEFIGRHPGSLIWKRQFWFRVLAVPGLTSLFAWIAILPLSAYFFHQISLVALLSNLILIPFSGVILGAGVFWLTVVGWAPILDSLMTAGVAALAKAFLWLVGVFAHFNWASLSVAAWDGWLLAGWFLFLSGWAFYARRKQAAILFGSAILMTCGHRVGAAFSRPRIYLFADADAYRAAYAEEGNQKYFCRAAAGGYSELNDFLKTRGFTAGRDACAGMPPGARTRPSGAFAPGPGQLAFSCGRSVFYFPLSPFPIIGQDHASRTITCRDGEFK